MRAESYHGLPLVSAARMRDLDRLATEKFGLSVRELMANAGRAVAAETVRFLNETLRKDSAGAPIAVCCGRGANGGDGLVAARALAEAGARVSVLLCPPKTGARGISLPYPDYIREGSAGARQAGAAVAEYGPACGLRESLKEAVVALDALLGTGSSGKPSGPTLEMIEALNAAGKPVLAVDIPSGLDGDTGARPGACVRAAQTLTLGLPKRGLLSPEAREFVGELKVLDIGYPPEILRG